MWSDGDFIMGLEEIINVVYKICLSGEIRQHISIW